MKQKIASVPTEPGCYLYKDKTGKIIYVGKAKNLRKRVSSYFNRKDLDVKTKMLVERINDIDFIVTDSESEALILENNLIKKYYPRYNLDLKDSRRYAYISVIKSKKEDFPYVEIVRSREGASELYGPFTSGAIRKQVVDVLHRYFGIFTKKPSKLAVKNVDREEYLQNFERAKKILKGKVHELIGELSKDMKEASKKTRYEYALVLRKQIDALKFLEEKQRMELSREVDAHVINYFVNGGKMYLMLFNIRKGIMEGKKKFVFDLRNQGFEHPQNEFGIFEEFLLQYYSERNVPSEVILPHDINSVLVDYLESKGKVKVIVPKKGDKKVLLDLVIKNINASFFNGLEGLIDLGKILKADGLLKIIECFDISHLGGTNTVASMVSFRNGTPDKSNYRKFKIRAETGGDDFLAMEEVVRRRYTKLKNEGLEMPDLVVIDGGKGQLNSALKVIKELKLKLNVISLAKREEEIYLPRKKEQINLDNSKKGMLLLIAIRDEAHRFAVSYNRLLRRKKLLGK